MGMGQKPVPLVNIPIPTKIGSKMGGEFTYPKWDPIGFDPQPYNHKKQMAVGQNYVLKVEPGSMETRTKTCGALVV